MRGLGKKRISWAGGLRGRTAAVEVPGGCWRRFEKGGEKKKKVERGDIGEAVERVRCASMVV